MEVIILIFAFLRSNDSVIQMQCEKISQKGKNENPNQENINENPNKENISENPNEENINKNSENVHENPNYESIPIVQPEISSVLKSSDGNIKNLKR